MIDKEAVLNTNNETPVDNSLEQGGQGDQIRQAVNEILEISG